MHDPRIGQNRIDPPDGCVFIQSDILEALIEAAEFGIDEWEGTSFDQRTEKWKTARTLALLELEGD